MVSDPPIINAQRSGGSPRATQKGVSMKPPIMINVALRMVAQKMTGGAQPNRLENPKDCEPHRETTESG